MSLATELVAGGFAGAVGIMATQPLDTIRIRLQSTTAVLGRDRAYVGIMDCAKSMLRHEGVRGLWKGYASPTFTVGGMNAMLFLTYEATIRYLRDPAKDPNEEPDLRSVFLAGCVAGTGSSFINTPTELVKCLAQTNLKNKGTLMEEWHLGKFGITIIRDTPSQGLYFLLYESITRTFGKSELSTFLAGGISGAAAWASTYPIDVIKTRWTTSACGVYGGLTDCLVKTMQQGGWRVFLNGFGATMARALPQHAVVFSTYELIKSTLNE
eukprot:s179_g20.t1